MLHTCYSGTDFVCRHGKVWPLLLVRGEKVTFGVLLGGCFGVGTPCAEFWRSANAAEMEAVVPRVIHRFLWWRATLFHHVRGFNQNMFQHTHGPWFKTLCVFCLLSTSRLKPAAQTTRAHNHPPPPPAERPSPPTLHFCSGRARYSPLATTLGIVG